MAVRVKICGITRLQDLHAACNAGADALGFVFYEHSPRHVTIAAAAALVRELPPFVQSVGLFVNAAPAFIASVLQDVPLDLLAPDPGLRAGIVIAATPTTTQPSPIHAVGDRLSPSNSTLIATPIGTRR